LPAQAELVLGEGGCAGGGADPRRDAWGSGEGIHGHKGPGNDERGNSAQHCFASVRRALQGTLYENKLK
jgi:hypothetical protein